MSICGIAYTPYMINWDPRIQGVKLHANDKFIKTHLQDARIWKRHKKTHQTPNCGQDKLCQNMPKLCVVQ